MSCKIIIQRIWTNSAKFPIIIRILFWTIFTLVACDVINLLEWTIITCQIRIIPILRMVAFDTCFSIPKLIKCEIANTCIFSIVKNSASSAIITSSIRLILPFRTERTLII